MVDMILRKVFISRALSTRHLSVIFLPMSLAWQTCRIRDGVFRRVAAASVMVVMVFMRQLLATLAAIVNHEISPHGLGVGQHAQPLRD